MTTITDLQMQYGLSFAMAKLLLLLIDNKVVTSRMVEKEHKLTTDVRITIHRLRRRLDGTGIVIQSQRDVGYWLDTAARTTIAKAMGEELPPGRGGNSSDFAHPVPANTAAA